MYQYFSLIPDRGSLVTSYRDDAVDNAVTAL